MTWSVRSLTEPAIEPVTLTEAKLWCRVEDDDTSQDAMMLLLIRAARERAEQITAMAFARRTFELRGDAFPEDDGAIWLPYPPIVSVQYVTYGTDDGDVALTGSPENWSLDVGGAEIPARLSPLYGSSWPSGIAQAGTIRIGYTAGHLTASTMPATVRLWMQARISTWNEFREQIAAGSVNALPRDFVDGLLDHYRARTFFA